MSRQALLAWVNELLQLNYTKLDQLGTGEAYVQIMDSIYGDVPLAKIKFGSTSSHDHANNYKLLQAIFNRHQINRNFDQQRLLKCRLQDNLDFVQWMHKFWEENAPKGAYDAVGRRGAKAAAAAGAGSRASMSPSRNAASRLSRTSRSTSIGHEDKRTRNTAAPRASSRVASRAASRTAAGTAGSHTPAQSQQRSVASRITSLKLDPPVADPRLAELEAHVDELEHSLSVVATERTLYYSKLLQIEEILQMRLDGLYEKKGDLNDEDPEVELVRTIQSILYATADGFETPYRPEDEPF